MHKDLDETYRQLRAQQQLNIDTSDGWNRLEESLDLEQLWSRVDSSLTRRRRRKIVFLTLTCFFIPLSAYLLYHGLWNSSILISSGHEQLAYSKNVEHVEFATEAIIPRSHWSNNRDTLSNSNPKSGSQFNSVEKSNTDLPNGNSQSPRSFLLEVKHQNVSTGNGELPTKQPSSCLASGSTYVPISVKTYYLNKPRLAMSLMLGNDTNIIEQSNPKRYYLNLTTGLKTTWLLNNHTYKSTQKESFEYLQRQYYPIASFGFGVLLNDKHSLEANLLILDFGGQHVNYLSEGKSIQLQTRLRYVTLELIGGYQLKKVLHPFRFNVYPTAYMGVYSSVLVNSKIMTNEINADRNKSFRKGDFGLVCRIGFAVPIDEKFKLQAGLGAQYGIINISETQASVPDYFDRSYNVACSAFLSVQYFLK